ncbi:MAG TPA: helix-turn-helix domain-containing protein [Clostridia bacterium]|nr:helix-turn-helix domain-containing protein [Clostridia bacterium]
MIEYNAKNYVCHLDLAMDLIRGKWKAVILCHIHGEPKRFLELKRMTTGISQKVLSDKLTDLEKHGLIHREVYPEVPPKVEYSLTQMGLDLFPALNHLENWSIEYF